MSSHTEAAYNKFTNQGKGTLVGNWNEERSLREFTGVGRRVVREHIPKKHCDFDHPIISDKPLDDTQRRIYGQKHYVPMISETFQIGKSSNPADALPKVGRKTLNLEQEIAAKVAQEIADKERAIDFQKEKRHWDTTTFTTYQPQDYQANTIGRRVMKNQDGQACSFNERDEQLIVEHGTWRRLQKQPDEELYQKIPKGDYTQTQSVSYWTQFKDRKNYYMSAATGPNPFSRTSGLTQTADQTKAVSGFYGNIDFPQEGHQVDYRKSTGTDLNLRNPYCEKEVTVSNFSEITKRIVRGCQARSAAHVLRCLRVIFRDMDKSKDGLIDPVEFKFGLKTLGIDISEDELKSIMKYFDTRRTGKICLDDMLHAMRSNSMNETRQRVVEDVYSKLDVRGGNSVTIEDLKCQYDVTVNPEYVAGTKSKEQLVEEFLQVWDGRTQLDAIVTFEQFFDYYKDVSPSIIADHVFENMLRNTWNK